MRPFFVFLLGLSVLGWAVGALVNLLTYGTLLAPCCG